MKFTYHTTRQITTADLYDATDPPLIFQVKTRLSRDWLLAWDAFGEAEAGDVSAAADLVAEAFISVTQDGEEIYPLDSKADALALRDAIEEAQPGAGDAFLRHLALAFGTNHYRYLDKRLGN